MKLSIVIPNYNGRDLLAECLPAVKAAIRRAGLAGEAEIIVADDASTDDSLDWLARTHYDVIAVGSRRNRGFAATANAGIAAACGEWIALLNNDTAVDRDWIVAAANHFDNPKVGSIATRVVFYDQDQRGAAGRASSSKPGRAGWR